MSAYFSVLVARRFILMTLVRRELRIRYKDSFLGWLWIFGAPLLMMATYTIFVLGVIRPDSAGGDARWLELAGLWLCLGLWQWLAESANRSVTAFHDNAQLVKRTPIPLSLLPATNIIVSAISFLIPLGVSFGVLIWSGQGLRALGGVAIAVVSFLPWLIAFSYFVSIIGTYLKDAKHAMPLLMNVGLFLSPVLYSATGTPKLLSTIMVFNPFSSSLGAVRLTALGGNLFGTQGFWVVAAVGLLAMWASFKFFILRKKDFYDVV
jgi:lipopolysaccharide transport system permease protein